MPTYTFQDKKTGETWEEICSWDDRCAYLKDNPHIDTIIVKAPAMVGSRYTSGIKNDGGWQENLSRIAEAHPGSALASQHGSKDSKTVKTRQAVDKWRKQTGKT